MADCPGFLIPFLLYSASYLLHSEFIIRRPGHAGGRRT